MTGEQAGNKNLTLATLRAMRDEVEQQSPTGSEQPAGQGKSTQAQKLITLTAGWDFFHHGDDAYARIEVDGHAEVHALRRDGARRLLKHAYYRENGSAPSAQAFSDAMGVIEGLALYEGEERNVHCRIAPVEDGIYWDLGSSDWGAIEIRKGKWSVVDRSPVMFRRAPGYDVLPVPQPGGSLAELRPLMNVGSDDDWRLLAGWALSALSGRGPYPILGLTGEQGTAKTSMARMLRGLIDPNLCALRSPPRTEHDLVIAARNGHIIGLDNLTVIREWLSDGLCRISTGGGYSTRGLYTDDREELFADTRPILFTGITNPATAGDLLDRSIILDLPRIPDRERRQERLIQAEYEKVRPYALAGLCDALAFALQNLPRVQIAEPPRMADAAYWVEAAAAAPALGWEPRQFLAAFVANRAERSEHALGASLIAGPLRAAIEELHALTGKPWEGTAGELLVTLSSCVGDGPVRRHRDWPQTALAMRNALVRLAPDLRTNGINVEQLPRTKNARSRWRIEKVGEGSSSSSPGGREPASVRQEEPVTGDDDMGDDAGDGRRDDPPQSSPAATAENPRPSATRDDEGDDDDDRLQTSSTQSPTCPHCGSESGAAPVGGRVFLCCDCARTFSAASEDLESPA
jgi:hypothetical protein